MSFPSNPTNGQNSTVNNINYAYSTSTNRWLRVLGTTSNTATNWLGGTVNNAVTFTNIVSITNTTSTTSTTTGALTVAGGVGVGGGVFVGGVVTATNMFVGIWPVSTGSVGGSFTGGTITNPLIVNNITNSTSTNTGALQVTGGVGIGRNLTIGGITTYNSTTYFNMSGDEQVVSLDVSIFRTGSWSVTASGSLYALVNEPIMWYWIHNCSINSTNGNFNNRDDSGPVSIWILTESMVIKTFVCPGDITNSVPTNFVQTSAQDSNNGSFTIGGIGSNAVNVLALTTPSQPVGTGSTTGGTLAAGNYYIRVVALDQNGETTTPSTESAVVTTTGATGSISYVIYPLPGVRVFRIYVTQTSGTYTSGYFTFNPDYITNTFVLTTLTGATAGTIPSLNSTGGINIAANVTAQGVGYFGINATSTNVINPSVVAKGVSAVTTSGQYYTQAALLNGSATGSADWIAYVDTYVGPSLDQGWADFGVTGSAFSDPAYTITGKQDGYIFAGSTSTAGNGNLVFATGGTGAVNDIVFATGGFLANNEKMRFISSSSQFYIKTTTPTTSTTTGALQVAGGVGVGGGVFVGGVVTATNMFVGIWAVSTGSGGGSFTGGTVAGATTFSNTTPTTSTTTGALQVAGGVGVGGGVFVGGAVTAGGLTVANLSTVSNTVPVPNLGQSIVSGMGWNMT